MCDSSPLHRKACVKLTFSVLGSPDNQESRAQRAHVIPEPPLHSVTLFLCLLDRLWAFLGTLTPIFNIHPLWLSPVPTSCSWQCLL